MEQLASQDDAIVRDCKECRGRGFRLSAYRGPDAPRKKTNCVPCNGSGIKIIRGTGVNHDAT